jgi:hypothetical protein
VQDVMAKDKNFLTSLNKLLAANDRLNNAIVETRKMWPSVTRCWIDQVTEPTKLLEHHKLGEPK